MPAETLSAKGCRNSTFPRLRGESAPPARTFLIVSPRPAGLLSPAWKERGLFDKATAQSFRENILEKYGALDLMTQYKIFRDAEPKIEPLLKRRGLTAQQ